MAKNTSYYFSHDYNSRSDQKIKALLVKHGMAGYGIFWAIIEELYNNSNELRTYYDSIAYDLRVDVDLVKSVINDFDLFVFEGDYFGSKSVESRLIERQDKSKKASQSVTKRWEMVRMNNERITNVSKSDTIKERKGKEIKESKEIKEQLFLPFDSENFIQVWNVLKRQPKWKGKTNDSLQAALKKLSKFNESIAIIMMENTIEGNWQGLFELKNSPINDNKRSNIDNLKDIYNDTDGSFARLQEKYKLEEDGNS